MANLSDFFPAGGGGGALTNTFAVFSINSGGVNPNFDSATKIYTDENGGKWLETGNTIDVTDAISAEYPYANSKFFNYNTLSANATSGTRDINGWTSSFLYDFTSSTNFKFFARKYRSYNNQIGFYSYNYSGAGTIITHPPSNSAGTPTPIPYGYNPNNAAGEQGVMLIASGNDMLLQLFSVTSHSTTATATIATYTNGNLNAQNKVRHAYFDGNSANSNIHVPYVVSNAIKLDIYSYSGGAYSLSSTKTLALTSDTLTVPYTGDLADNLYVVEYNSTTGQFAVYWNNKIIIYSDETTIASILNINVTGNTRSRVPEFNTSSCTIARQTSGGGSIQQYKSSIGESNVVTQSVLANSADSLTVFKKIN